MTYFKTIIIVGIFAVLLSFIYGCYATYEREEYYQNGQLKEKETARGMSVRPRGN